ncbi:MAG TPA: ATP-binding protein [Planctomycetota bacterium]|nr:ATP-binding protein [Planctomycetota bacterium]
MNDIGMDACAAEASHWDADACYRLVVDAVLDFAIVVIDPEGLIRTWNAGAIAIFGHAVADAVGRPISMLYTLEDVAAGVPELELAAARRAGRAEDERWQLRRDGARFFASGVVTPLFWPDGRLRAYTKVLRDATARRRELDEMRDFRQRLELAQDAARFGTWEWDLQTDREIWPRSMYRLYDIPHGKVIATYDQWRDLIHPDDVRPVERTMAEAIADHRLVTAEFRLAGNGERWILLRARATYDDDGKPLKLIGVQVDITERKHAEEALKRVNTDLQQFASLAAHDLKEPLRMVSSYLSLLRRNYEAALDQRARQYIHYAADGAGRMMRLVQSLLELAQIDRGGVERRPVLVAAPIAEAVHNLTESIAESHATLDVGEMPTVPADSDHLARLFQNLIANAIKYRRADVPPRIGISARRSNGEWEFTVQDNGIGIREADRERVFGMFERLHSKQQYDGTGIGLALCRKIVERHHGRIWCDPVPGGGTAFRFTLPAESESQQPR